MKHLVTQLVATILESTDAEHFHKHKSSMGPNYYILMVAILSSTAKPPGSTKLKAGKILDCSSSYQYRGCQI